MPKLSLLVIESLNGEMGILFGTVAIGGIRKAIQKNFIRNKYPRACYNHIHLSQGSIINLQLEFCLNDVTQELLHLLTRSQIIKNFST